MQMRSVLSATIAALPLFLVACGSSGSSDPVPSPAAAPRETTKPKKAEPKKEDEKKEDEKKEDEKKEDEKKEDEKKEDEKKEVELPAAIKEIQGNYYSSFMYAGGLSRSLVIEGTKYVSTVRGNVGSMIVVTEQTESGSVVVAADGSVELSRESSSCDGLDEAITSRAKLANFKSLTAGEGALNFMWAPSITEVVGTLPKVEAIPTALEEGDILRKGCFYEKGIGKLAVHQID